ncbi:MAG TPA: HNH endonuclease [Candidatus Saccharimonadales bacterium]|nr:HNH endonuclease [Candidatus Saccharimonadales bacterium]
MPLPSSRNVDVCIYCGKTEGLTDEHVIPKALDGKLTLLRATCKECGDMTSKFEGDLLSRDSKGACGLLWDLRASAAIGVSRRGTTKNPEMLQFFQDIQTGETTEAMVPVDEYVGFVILPIFNEPLCIIEGDDSAGSSLSTSDFKMYVLNADRRKPGYRYGGRNRTRNGDFPRFLAKVAYCFAIFNLGYEEIKGSEIVSIISNTSNEQSKWIGCTAEKVLERQGEAMWAIAMGKYGGRLCVKVRIMPQLIDSPEYLVVVK